MIEITKEASEKIKEMYLNHAMIADIIHETGISRTSITTHLKKLGIYRKYGAIYTQNDNFFDIIDNEKKAY